MIIPILKMIFALFSVAFGVFAIFQPKQVAQAAFLTVDNANGQAEIRASWGGLFIALGAAAIALSDPEAYLILGLAYAGIAVVRLLNWMVNSSLINQTVVFVLIFEVLSAVIFVLPEGLF